MPGSDASMTDMPVFVAARLTSRRLPGKALRTVNGTPLLGYVVAAARQSRGKPVVVTSVDPSDDPIVAWCEDAGVEVQRGSLNDVARRMMDAATALGVEVFVRVSGDSPMMDPRLIDVAIDLFSRSAGEVDLITNVHPRTFPKGQSVEVIVAESLRQAAGSPIVTAEMREHVTAPMYADPSAFSIVNFTVADLTGAGDGLIDARPPQPSYADVQLSVDDVDDLHRFACVVRRLRGEPWQAGWLACVEAAALCTPMTATS